MAHLLGDIGYGVVALALTIYFLGSNLLGLGLGQGVGRYYPQAETSAERRSILLTAYSLGVPFSIVGGALILVFADPIAREVFDKPALISVIQILAIALPITVAQQLAMGTIRGQRKTVSRTVIKDIIEPIVRFSGIIVLILAGFDTIGVAASYFIAATISTLILTVVVSRETEIVNRATAWEWRPVEMLSFSLPLAGSTILWRLMTNIDTLLIGALIASSAALAHYNIAFVLSQTTLLIYNSLGFIYVPELSDLYGAGEFDRAEQFYRASTKWFFLLSYPFILVSLLYPEYIITFIYSNEYAPATVPYLILALGLLIHIAFGQIQNTLTAFGNTRIIFIVDVFAVGANAWLNWTLIPMLGITGAAIATATTYTVRNMTLMAFLYYKHGFHPVSRNYITVVLLVTLAAVGISRVELSPSLPLVVASGAILIATTGVGYLRYGISEADVKLFDRLEVRFGRSFGWLRRAHLSVRK